LRGDCKAVGPWFLTEEDALMWGGTEAPWPDVAEGLWQSLSDAAPGAQTEAWVLRQGLRRRPVGLYALSIGGEDTLLHHVAIAPPSRGQGLAAALVAHAVDRAFARIDCHSLWLRVFGQNAAAIAAYAKAGFRPQRVERAALQLADGRVWDLVVMARRRP
jgi:RimJ/RimL family protein N-acetyltransferase